MNNFSIYSIALILSIFYLPLAQANPGGVSTNLQLWLKAGTGISETDGQAITSWTDQSTNSYTASNGGSDSQTSPTFRDNISDNINYNPTIEFDGTANGVDLASNYIYSSSDGLTFFAIVKPDIKANQINFIFDFGRTGDTGYGFVYANDAFQIYTPISHGGIISNVINHSYNTDPIIYTGKIDFGNEQRVYLNGTSFYNNTITLTKLTTSEITEGPVHSGGPDQGPVSIGRMSKKLNGSNRLFDGKIAEVILYDADLTDADRNKVQSYLAIKYGITLDSSIDYVDSNDTVIYPSTTTHSSYINDIAGIGTDNGSSLNQPKSISVNSDSIITITGSGIADGNLLIWGNDNGALTFSSIESSTGIRLAREWKIAETGDVGNVTVSFDLSSVSGADLVNVDRYSLLTDINGDFSDATKITGAIINGNSVELSGVNLADDQYFSLAYTEPNTAPIAGFDMALNFDGVNDNVKHSPAVTTAVNNVTMEAWVNWQGSTPNNTYPVIFNNGDGGVDGYILQVDSSDNTLRLLLSGINSYNSNYVLPTNTWHHLALVRKNGTWKLYVDSIIQILTSTQTPNIPSARTMLSSAGKSFAFKGSIDEFRIWEVARTQAQIQANMDNTLTGAEPNLVGYWKFEDNTGTTVIDSSLNGNDGTLTGGMTWNFLTNQNTTLSGSLADFVSFDADGDTLTYSIVDDDSGATVLDNASTGAFTYTPTTSGTRTFTYKVNDGLADSNIATITVTSLVIDNVSNTDDGDYSTGQNTLREAIANASAGDTITFDSSIAGQTIILAEQLTIDKNLTIDGTGQSITISGDNTTRVFYLTVGPMTLDNLTIVNGNANGNTSNNGGGIMMDIGKTLTINNCTFSNNSAIYGGVIYSNNNSNVTINNTTFTNNSASVSAGGLSIETGATGTINNSTFSNNSGGIVNYGNMNIKNVIIANSISDNDCVNNDTISTNTNNLIEDGSCSPALSGDPELSTLADNGGDTQTIALLAESPAINAGDNATCETTDQRGETRPKNTTCDIGAYEYELKAPTSLAGNAVFQTQIDLSWIDNSVDETGFIIERNGSTITTTVTDITNYSDSNLFCETTYNYFVKATNANGDSNSTTFSATTSICLPPNTPTNLTDSSSQTQINLSWIDNSTDETGFIIERDGSVITTTDADITNYSDSNLSCGTAYNYSIKATNTNGDSNSITIIATTSACVLPANVEHLLMVNKTGNGTITSSYGINCGNDCENEFANQTEVFLTAVPDTGWIFDSWTGDCNENGEIRINSDKNCTAIFQQQFSLTINVIGQGIVDDCGTSCVQTYLNGEAVNLTTTTEGNWVLDNWSGDCDETIIIDNDKTCTATFVKGYPLSIIIGTGTGIVKTETKKCAENCEEIVTINSTTTLIAEPKVEWIFDDWSGDCDAGGTVNMSNKKTCTVNFIKDPNIPNNGDGNGDGIHDADQPNVVSMQDQSSGNYLTLDIKGNVTLKEIYTDLAENQDYFEDKYIFPQGLVYFELEETEANITIYYHSLQKLRATPIFQKFGTKVPGDMDTLGWFVLPNVIFNTVQVGEKSVVTANYKLKDGQLGDSTGVDGRIVDPGGLSFER